MQSNAIDFTEFKKTGQITEPVTPEYARHCCIKAEIKRVERIILSYEHRIEDLRRLHREMATVEGYEFVGDCIERDLNVLNHARMLRTVVDQSA